MKATVALIFACALVGTFAYDDAYLTLQDIEKTEFGKTLIDTV